MDYDSGHLLATRVVAAARTSLDDHENRVLAELMAHAEPALALKFALDHAIAGRWVVPSELVPGIRQWGAENESPRYRRAAEKAIALVAA